MIFIDDDTWPPSLHGTGTEDYFNHAWGMQKNAYPYNGTIVHEADVPGYQPAIASTSSTRCASTADPGDHGARPRQPPLRRLGSTAYWYQRLPTVPFDIPSVEARLPLRPIDSVTEQTVRPEPTNEQRSAREQVDRRMAEFRAQRRRLSEERFASVRRSEQGNLRQAADIRARFDRHG